MNFSDVAGLVLSSALVSSLLTQLVNHWLQLRRSKTISIAERRREEAAQVINLSPKLTVALVNLFSPFGQTRDQKKYYEQSSETLNEITARLNICDVFSEGKHAKSIKKSKDVLSEIRAWLKTAGLYLSNPSPSNEHEEEFWRLSTRVPNELDRKLKRLQKELKKLI